MKYNHTQIGYLMIFVLFFVLLCFSFVIQKIGVEFYSLSTMIFIILIFTSFLTLNVNIDEQYLNIKFWYWLYTNSFLLSDIKSVKSVKNHWYIWWWIRFWFWPKIIIYNVSWFDAVEIVLENGKIYRIWTDEPNLLENAIKKSIIM